MELALDNKGKEFLFNFDRAQYSAEEILRNAEQREPEFHSGLWRTLIWKTRSSASTLCGSILAVFGSRHWIKSQKPKWTQKELSSQHVLWHLCWPVTPQTHLGTCDLPENLQSSERQDHFFSFFRISSPVPLATEIASVAVSFFW